MRPKLPEHEKRTEIIRLLLTKEEKQRLDSLVRTGKFGCRSDYIRYAIFRRSVKKEVHLDSETKERLNNLDYELNRIGVNLNQLSKKMNSFSTYNVGDNDRHLLRQAFQMMMQCLAFLQKHLR
ncbi:plasmid mobilization relaxosome protein MobC [Draconibacterium sediminis]|uniref:plasmid mobilization protein n=1 Tax=Draconibacterium sediminis TaxID=1544798 RepID=UPI0026EBABA2|nr:plasmid mobilization relaxosome protein MobC [Draconibacterium sediminis]